MFWKRRLLTPEQEQRLVDAIGRAERGNQGEVLLHLEARHRGDALERARKLFSQRGLDRTRDGTGVLLYVAVGSRKAAIYAGDGLHGAADVGFWQSAIDAVADGYRNGTPVEGLEAALDRIGDVLREFFPAEDTAGNEIPDAVSTS